MDVETLRKSYLPSKIKVLFIAEAKPDANDRFFYYDKVNTRDYLYLHLMYALYDKTKADTQYLRDHKVESLNRFKQDGYYLVDAVDEIVARSKPAPRVKAIRANADKKIAEIESLISQYGSVDTKIVIISATVHKVLYEPLKSKFNVVNDSAIYFPSNGRQSDFLRQMSKIVKELHQ